MKKESTTHFDTVSVPEALRAAMKTASAKRDKDKTEPYAAASKRDISSSSAQPGATRRRG